MVERRDGAELRECVTVTVLTWIGGINYGAVEAQAYHKIMEYAKIPCS